MKVSAGPPASVKTQALRAGKNPPAINQIISTVIISTMRIPLVFL